MKMREESPDNRYKVVGSRKARVDESIVHGNKWAVFMHTFYLGSWFYDGCREFDTEEEARQFQERWLQGAPKWSNH